MVQPVCSIMPMIRVHLLCELWSRTGGVCSSDRFVSISMLLTECYDRCSLFVVQEGFGGK